MIKYESKDEKCIVIILKPVTEIATETSTL